MLMRFFPRQVLQEEVLIPGSDLKMTYLSSRASGYKPVLKVAMTQSSVPFNLMKVRQHLKIFIKPCDPPQKKKNLLRFPPGSSYGRSGGSAVPEVVSCTTQSILHLHLGQNGRLWAACVRPVGGSG